MEGMETTQIISTVDPKPHWKEQHRRVKHQVNQRAHQLAQEQYENYRKAMWAEIHAGNLDLEDIEDWKP